jgi:hypothetical protein
MRGLAGRIFRGQGHNVLDDRRRVERLAAGRAGFVAQQPAEALAHEPLLPAPHDGFGAPVPRMIALVPSPSAVSKMMFARQTVRPELIILVLAYRECNDRNEISITKSG